MNITKRKYDFVLTHEGCNSHFVLSNISEQMLNYFIDVLRFESEEESDELVKLSVSNNRLCVTVPTRNIVCLVPWHYDIPFKIFAGRLINTVHNLCNCGYNNEEIEEIISEKYIMSHTKSATKI